MNLFRVSILLLALSCGTAFAQSNSSVTPNAAKDSETLDVAREFISVTKSGDSIKELLPIMSHSFVAVMMRDNPNQGEVVNQLINHDFIPAVASHLGEMNDRLAEIYANHLSADDMRQLIAFYKTPVGQKYLQTRPAIMTETMKAATIWSHAAVQDALRNLITEMKKSSLKIPKEMEMRAK